MAKNGDKFCRHSGENGEKINGKNDEKSMRKRRKSFRHFRHNGENGEKIDGENG